VFANDLVERLPRGRSHLSDDHCLSSSWTRIILAAQRADRPLHGKVSGPISGTGTGTGTLTDKA